MTARPEQTWRGAMTHVCRSRPAPTLRFATRHGPAAVVLVNGGSAKAVPAPGARRASCSRPSSRRGSPTLAFAEVRYRVKSWNELDSCIADAAAALDLVARPSLLVGFSMGGAVSIAVAGHDAGRRVARPCTLDPDRLSLDGLRGKRLDVLHGAWDRYLPGIPGVSAGELACSGFERARGLGVDGTYTLIPRGLHGAALRRRREDRAPAARRRLGRRVCANGGPSSSSRRSPRPRRPTPERGRAGPDRRQALGRCHAIAVGADANGRRAAGRLCGAQGQPAADLPALPLLPAALAVVFALIVFSAGSV